MRVKGSGAIANAAASKKKMKMKKKKKKKKRSPSTEVILKLGSVLHKSVVAVVVVGGQARK